MAANREIELKYALTETEYRRLRRGLRNPSTVRFTNTFFDTPNRVLRKKGIGCRIRWIPGKPAILTVKHGGGTKGGLHRRQEIESSIPASRARRILSGKAPLSSLAGSEPMRVLLRLVGAKAVAALTRLGSLATSRTKFKFSGLTGELNRCRLGRAYFHELEVESDRPKEADRLTRSLLEARGIPIRPESRTKLGRFFASLARRG